MHLFSSAFDESAVDFLEEMSVPAHKVASFELVDVGLIQKMARTGKPLIMSTGMASEDEIVEAVSAVRAAGGTQIALLKCTSAYPASPQDANLRTIPAMAHRFGCPVGLSDHTMGIAVPAAAIAWVQISSKSIYASGAPMEVLTPPSLSNQKNSAQWWMRSARPEISRRSSIFSWTQRIRQS